MFWLPTRSAVARSNSSRVKLVKLCMFSNTIALFLDGAFCSTGVVEVGLRLGSMAAGRKARPGSGKLSFSQVLGSRAGHYQWYTFFNTSSCNSSLN